MQSLSLMIALNMVPKLKVFVEDVGGVFFFFLERERACETSTACVVCCGASCWGKMWWVNTHGLASNVYFQPHQFAVLKWYENVCARAHACVCVQKELEVCAMLAYPHQFILYYASVYTQAHAHMHPHTIWGQQTDGAKSGYCSLAQGRCYHSRYWWRLVLARVISWLRVAFTTPNYSKKQNKTTQKKDWTHLLVTCVKSFPFSKAIDLPCFPRYATIFLCLKSLLFKLCVNCV